MGTRRTTKPSERPRHFIREWRKHRGLNQTQLAERVGTSISTISQLENAHQGYSQALLEELAYALMCETWELLNVNPLKEGEVVDLSRMLRDADPVTQADIIGYVKGRLQANER